MHPKTLDVLRKSELVREIISVDFDAIGGSHRLKVRVRLRNNWLMDVWEHVAPAVRRYSYHVFYRKKMMARWDNAPHFPRVKTHPHHKHVNHGVRESKEMTIELVLEELRKMIK